MADTTIESLDSEARGVSHVDGKAIFIVGALPFERVSYTVTRRRPSYEVARLDAVLDAVVRGCRLSACILAFVAAVHSSILSQELR